MSPRQARRFFCLDVSSNRRAAALAVIGLTLGLAMFSPALAADAPAGLADASAAAEQARRFEPKATLGPARLFAEQAGLAVDRSSPGEPKVVAYVGPSWIVPLTASDADGSAAMPKALILDRGTGELVARAHDVVALPQGKAGVYYLDGFQLPHTVLKSGDTVTSINGGLQLLLEMGGQPVRMSITPNLGRNLLTNTRNVSVVTVPFGGGAGKMMTRTFGNNLSLVAVNADGSLSATITAPKQNKMVERFKEVIAELTPRPEPTMIWPADARPWASVEGWSSSPYLNSDVGVWQPTARPQNAPRGFANNVAVNTQVFVAARMLHPYEMLPDALGRHVESAKPAESKPVNVKGWVGTERIFDIRDTANPLSLSVYYLGRNTNNQNQLAYRVRLLDLHRDVRRLVIRCQCPAGEFAKWADQFDTVIKELRISEQLLEPVVVPLQPASYKAPPKKD